MLGRRIVLAFALIVAAIAIACGSFDSAASASPSDGGAEAGADAGHTFFDDFDNGPLGAKWTNVSVGAPATLELVTTDPVSPPNALRAAFPDNDGGYFRAELMQRFDRSTRSLTCRAKLFVVEHSEEASPSIMNVSFRIPSSAPFGNTGADLSIKGSGSMVSIFQDEAGEPTYPTSSLGLRTQAWMDVAMTIDADARTMTVSVDGTAQITGKFPAAIRPNEGFEIRFGAFDVGTGDSAEFRFDDFSCDVVFD